MSGVEDLFDVGDARVVVTGAASGLGLAMAEVMADAGARVTLADLDPTRLEEETARLADAGGQVRSFQLDVSDREQVQALIDDVVSEQDGVDVLYANAGISLEPGFTDPKGGIGAIETETWDKVIGVNLNGVVFTMGAAAEVMKRQGSGKIVVTASNAGLKVEPLVGYSYAATKAAVIHVVRQAAVELAPHGVNVNAIAPGYVETDNTEALRADPERYAAILDRIPAGRWARPQDFAGAVVFLASAASDYVHGAVLAVDGGWLAR
jgi:NAD(P)-dependent dehydrogenase (short-subunit alcohol dehydrogenase family)